MKKSVLFVVDERQTGGVSVVLSDLLHFLNYDYFEVDLLILHDHGNMLNDLPKSVHRFFGTPFFEAVDYSIKEVIKTGNLSLIIKKIILVYGMKTGRIKQMILKERHKLITKKYDVEVAFKDGFCALFTGYGDTPNKVHWLHSSYQADNPNSKYPKLFQEVLSYFNHIIGVSTNVIKEFNEIYHLESITEMIPVAVDVNKIREKSKGLSGVILRKDDFNFISVGRLHIVKGYDRIIKVFGQLKRENLLHSVKYYIFGGGTLEDELKRLIHLYQLDDVVVLAGETENSCAQIKEFDMLLVPSYSESFGLVMIESFICGVPVMTTQTAGSSMLMKDDYGMIVENCEDGLYQGLKTILESPGLVREWKENLLDYQYNNEKILTRIEEILSK